MRHCILMTVYKDIDQINRIININSSLIIQ